VKLFDHNAGDGWRSCKSATHAYIVLLDIRPAAGEGGGAAQDEVGDDGGGTIMGGGKDCGDADGDGHGHRHGHGKHECSDAMLC
jgi:hypothetical protein